MGFLIPYVDPSKNDGNEDPKLNEFTYGDEKKRGKMLQGLKKGDLLFFHTSRKGKRVITAYYVVEGVMTTLTAQSSEFIKNKYSNPHLFKAKKELDNNDAIVFGNPITSFVLPKPFVLTPAILSNLSKPPNLNPNQTELAAISSALRKWKELSEKDEEYLLKEIQKSGSLVLLKDTILSGEEIEQLKEIDIEKFISLQPHKIGTNLKLSKRQLVLGSKKRPDLLLEDKITGDLVVEEIKKGSLGKDAYNQIKGYIKEARKQFKANVRGVLVGSSILPVFEDFYLGIDKNEVEVFLYGWKFELQNFTED